MLNNNFKRLYAASLVTALPVVLAQTENDDQVTLPPVTVEADTPTDYGLEAESDAYRADTQSVTGLGRQTLLETPHSVNVITRQIIEDQRAVRLADVIQNDASVQHSFSNPTYYDSVTIRGFSLDNWQNYKRNGLNHINQAVTALENIERVEIFKGLPGLYYGLGAPGGIVNYVTKTPTLAPLTRLFADVDEDGGYRLHGDLSRRFGPDDNQGLRVNAAYQDLNQYIDEIDGDRYLLAAAYEWRILPATTLNIDADHHEFDTTHSTGYPLLEGLRLPENVDVDRFLGQEWTTYHTRVTNLGARLEHAFNEDWAVTAQVLRQWLSRDDRSASIDDANGAGDYTFYEYNSPDEERDPLSGQLRVNGQFETGWITHDLSASVFGLDYDIRFGDGVFEPVGMGNIYQPTPEFAQSGLVPPRPYLVLERQEYGITLFDSIGFGEQWTVQIGARRFKVDYKELDQEGATTDRYEKTVTTPMVALIYQPRTWLSIYASYIEGFEQGGQAPIGTVNANEVLDPTESEQIEAGVKAEFGEYALVTLAGFEIDRALEFIDNNNRYLQSGRQVHRGLELSISGEPLMGLQVIGSALLLDAEQRKTGDPELDGNRPRFVAEEAFSLYADYQIPGVPGLSANGGIFYVGDRAVNDGNSDFADSYTRLDLGLKYATTLASRETIFRLNVENVTDESYWNSFDFGGAYLGRPRTVTASLQLDF
jgi:iron complex outermembrane receptor protein